MDTQLCIHLTVLSAARARGFVIFCYCNEMYNLHYTVQKYSYRLFTMLVKYLGPLHLKPDHPALYGCDLSQFSNSCYAVCVGEEAGVSGPLIEGDVLIVDEGRVPGHGDLVLAEVEAERRLFHYWRPGPRTLLRPVVGGGSLYAHTGNMKGVVVSLLRQYVA